MKINEVMEIAKWFNESELTKFKWEEGDSKLKLEKAGPVQYVPVEEKVRIENPTKTFTCEPLVREEKPVEEEKEEKGGFVVKAPVVGTYYSAPSPSEKPFVEVGQRVKAGEIICIVEAMKLLNEITSPVDGVVKEIYVENETLLEFEQKIMRIE